MVPRLWRWIAAARKFGSRAADASDIIDALTVSEFRKLASAGRAGFGLRANANNRPFSDVPSAAAIRQGRSVRIPLHYRKSRTLNRLSSPAPNITHRRDFGCGSGNFADGESGVRDRARLAPVELRERRGKISIVEDAERYAATCRPSSCGVDLRIGDGCAL